MENMMEKLRGTRTEENLRTAFAGESQARNKYSYYANKAEEDGYNQIAEIFRITAINEEQHAKIWFKLLNDGIGATAENLKNAAEGEHFEWTEMLRILPRLLRRRALRILRGCLAGWRRLSRAMSSGS